MTDVRTVSVDVWTCRFETQAAIQVLQQPVVSGHSLIRHLEQQEDKKTAKMSSFSCSKELNLNTFNTHFPLGKDLKLEFVGGQEEELS